MLHREMIVKGRVQGVYFRASTKAVADKLGVKGEVMNTPEGHVWIAAEAALPVLMEFLEWCKKGPALAEVREWEITEGPLKHYIDFTITRTRY